MKYPVSYTRYKAKRSFGFVLPVNQYSTNNPKFYFCKGDTFFIRIENTRPGCFNDTVKGRYLKMYKETFDRIYQDIELLDTAHSVDKDIEYLEDAKRRALGIPKEYLGKEEKDDHKGMIQGYDGQWRWF